MSGRVCFIYPIALLGGLWIIQKIFNRDQQDKLQHINPLYCTCNTNMEDAFVSFGCEKFDNTFQKFDRKFCERLVCHRLTNYSNLCLVTVYWSNFTHIHTKNPHIYQRDILFITCEKCDRSLLFSCTFLKLITQLLFFVFLPSPLLFSVQFCRQVTELKK